MTKTLARLTIGMEHYLIDLKDATAIMETLAGCKRLSLEWDSETDKYLTVVKRTDISIRMANPEEVAAPTYKEQGD
jgi:hypothetical protein